MIRTSSWLRLAHQELKPLHTLRYTALDTPPDFKRIDLLHPFNEHKRQVLHLLRAILRECTYLPDPQARKYMLAHCLTRFKAHKSDLLQAAETTCGRSAEDRVRRAVDKAKDALRYLQKANAGHKRHLTNVLEMAYGRTGKRRYELLAPFRDPSPGLSSNFDWSELSPELSDLLTSQWSRPGTDSVRSQPKKVNLEIPEKNSWGRPMPQKRVRNMKKKITGNLMSRVLPPIPNDEFDRLKTLALEPGATAKLARPRRSGSKNEVGMRSHTAQMPQSKKSKKTSRPHALTSRYLRRRFQHILMNTPVLKDTQTETHGEAQWNVEWTDVRKKYRMVIQPGRTLPLAMFEGVDAKGKRLTKSDPIINGSLDLGDAGMVQGELPVASIEDVGS